MDITFFHRSSGLIERRKIVSWGSITPIWFYSSFNLRLISSRRRRRLIRGIIASRWARWNVFLNFCEIWQVEKARNRIIRIAALISRGRTMNLGAISFVGAWPAANERERKNIERQSVRGFISWRRYYIELSKIISQASAAVQRYINLIR